MQNNKFDMMGLAIVTLSIITLLGTLAITFPLIFAQTNEGEGQMPEFNETEDETFSLITLNGEQIKEIRSNLNRTRQAIENGNTTEALANLTIIDEQFSAVSGEASAFGDFR
jgi:5-bromo-4-chloroindolyl phosphate hydrolysis protein